MYSKVVLITGSSQGIGKAIATRFLEAGYRVVINGRNQGKLEKTRKELAELGEVLAVKADVSSFQDCQYLVNETIKRFGGLDVLINNAGLSMEGELDGMNPKVFKQVVGVNLIGAANATNAALKEIRSSEGQILFVSSLAGLLGLPGYSAYSASKMALSALAQSLSGELKGNNVHVGLAYLGFTENDKDKTIFNAKGEIVGQPSRDFVKAAPVEWVAGRILLMVERRKKQAFIGPPGRIAAWVSWLLPQFCHWYAGHVYRTQVARNQKPKIEHQSLGDANNVGNGDNSNAVVDNYPAI